MMAPSEWYRVGALVSHPSFGTGEVVQVGDNKGVQSVWIAFDFGAVKALDMEFAAPLIRSLGEGEPRTPPDPAERCDVCGSRPVALTAGDQRFCLEHRSQYRP
jgi:hypothetical protein